MRNETKQLWAASTLTVLAILVSGGCGVDLPSGGSDGSAVAKSIDSRFQVTMPKGWTVQSDLNDSADIQVANPVKECYLIVLSESKADFDKPTIQWHSEITRTGVLESLSGGRITAGPKNLQINGRPAIQYEIQGTTEGLKVVYLHTTVDTGDDLHQILAWTLPSYYDENRTILESAINSFKAAAAE